MSASKVWDTDFITLAQIKKNTVLKHDTKQLKRMFDILCRDVHTCAKTHIHIHTPLQQSKDDKSLHTPGGVPSLGIQAGLETFSKQNTGTTGFQAHVLEEANIPALPLGLSRSLVHGTLTSNCSEVLTVDPN